MVHREEQQFNLLKISTKAKRLGKTTSGLKYGWLNPFNRYEYKSSPRANTFHHAERGEIKHDGDNDAATPLHHANTAPGILQSIGDAEFAPMAQGDETYDSQATTTGSPTTTHDEQGTRNRRKISGEPHGGSNFEDTSALEEDETPKRSKGDFTFKNQIQRTLLSSPINILLLAAPAGIALWLLKIPGPAVFVVNFIAIIPLATLLSDATEQVALRTGETVGGLINATFGNAVELIVAIIALIDNQVTVVQTSLVGSVLSNLLLVLGFCFLAGGFNRSEQYFNTTVAQTAASLLALAVASLIVPTVFSHTPDLYTNDAVTSLPSYAVPQLSHGVSIILLLIYFLYLLFQLKTHSAMFNEESQKVPKKAIFKKRQDGPEHALASGIAQLGASYAGVRDVDGNPIRPTTPDPVSEEAEDEEEPTLHLFVALASLTISTVIIALCAEGLVSGIEPISSVVSEEFIGLILIPIVGNACEHATAVTVAMKDKMDLAIGVAIGSSMQVALFLIPLLVIIGWGIGNNEMTLAFDTFQIVTLFVAVLLVNYLIGDGKSHWLEGVQLIALYVIIAVCAFYYPNGTGVMTAEAAAALRI
ncbi:putative Ca2+:h+ antiporter [Rosellinia necatrix]|uniref:Putative Ca2+:h+ antiporter n=1 Tax=Rosellinia necatrix TaxID=77044 RepID=A0A1W2TAX8_ROSNE|nr:putative Ca2+:h+ antiporter [Rosellinia necatrix]